MKYSFLLPLFLAITNADAQNIRLREKVNKLVHQIETTKGEIFTCKISSVSYQYKLINAQPALITRRFSKNNTKTEQHFYIKEGQLLFSAESETTFYGNDTIGIGWVGTYYFEEGQLKDYETLGHGKSEDENWKPAQEVTANFKIANKAVSNCMHKKRRF